MKKYYKHFLSIFFCTLALKSYAANLDYFNQGIKFFNQNDIRKLNIILEKTLYLIQRMRIHIYICQKYQQLTKIVINKKIT